MRTEETRIIVKQVLPSHQNGYTFIASPEKSPQMLGKGFSRVEALGDLILTHQRDLNMKVVASKEKKRN